MVECLIDSNIDDKIIIEQTSIFDDQKKELIVIGAIESNENIKCSDGELMAVNNKINANLSFRQVSQFNSISGTTTFVLNTISTESISSGTIKLKAYLINNENKEEKEVSCSYKSIDEIITIKKYQVNFDCSVDGTCDSLEIISSEDVTGINSDLDETQKNPKKTDEEIKKTENDDDLKVGKLYNFGLSEYINLFPPTLQLEKVESDLCMKYGKLTLTGSFDMDIQKEYDFELSLSYPSSTIKCTAPKTEKGIKVTIPCKVQKQFSESSHFIIEQMIIKKKYKEILFIPSFKYDIKISCSNFNKINEEKIQKKKESTLTFLQVNNFKPAPKPTFNLFIHSIGNLALNVKIIVIVFININRRMRLRNLEEIETTAECTPNMPNGSTGSGNIKLDCIVVSNEDLSSAEGLNIDSDEISGIPESADPAKTDIEIKEGTILDYNDEEVFKIVLPVVNNAEIDGDNCYNDGTFKIVNGVSTQEIINTDDIYNFDIKLSNPISSGFCNISSIENKNINLNCGSKDNFEINTVSMERQYIQKGNTTLFILNSADCKEPFSCIINSDYKIEAISEIINYQKNNITNSTESVPTENPIPTDKIRKRYNFYKNNGNSSGLSGGAIAAIIIVCVAALVIIGVLFGLIKSGKILGRKNDELADFNNNSSTAQAVVYHP